MIKMLLALLTVPALLLTGTIHPGSRNEEAPEPEESTGLAVLVWDKTSSKTSPGGLYVSVDAREFVHVPEEEVAAYYLEDDPPPPNTCPTTPYPQCVGNPTCPPRTGKILVGCVANFSTCGCFYLSNPDGGSDWNRAMVDLYLPTGESRGEREITFVDGGQVKQLQEAVEQGLTLEYWLEF
jgi:hypothetical protein